MTTTRRGLISIEEANRMLPLVSSIAQSIQSTWEQIITARHHLEAIEKNYAMELPIGTTEESVKAELNLLIDKINGYIYEVEQLGCFVEEFKRGIINFPCAFLGRKVFLCWRLGEDSVEYWHELDETYNDRRPIGQISNFYSKHTSRGDLI